MRQFGHLVISFQVDGKIHPEVIWNPKRISVREIHPLRASVIEFGDGKRNRPSGTVFTRKSNIDSFTQLVITYKIGIVRLIKITWIPFGAIDLLLLLRRICLHQRTAVGVGQRPIQFSLRFFQVKFLE